jgi:predicted lipoprotein with Yx(FWY)xxD motif
MRTEPVIWRARQSLGAKLLSLVMLVGTLAVVTAMPSPASAEVTHKVHPPKVAVFSEIQPGLGTILTTQAGYTLYTNVGDTQSNSFVATQSFASAWPPLLVPVGHVLFAGRGIVGLGTFNLPNGQVQATWQGMPLYTFIKDTAPHVVTGNGVRGFVVAFVQLQKKK